MDSKKKLTIRVERGFMTQPYQPYNISFQVEIDADILLNEEVLPAYIEYLGAMANQSFESYMENEEKRKIAGFTETQLKEVIKKLN